MSDIEKQILTNQMVIMSALDSISGTLLPPVVRGYTHNSLEKAIEQTIEKLSRGNNHD